MYKDVSVRKAGLKDTEKFRELRLQLVKENPKTYGVLYTTEKKKPLSHYKKIIIDHQTNDSAVFILVKDTNFIGMGIVQRDNNKDETVGYLGSLGILKEYQGQGLGEYLLKYRLDWIKENTKFKKIKTIVLQENTKMISLAKKHGFKVVGEGSYYNLPEYYLEKTLE